MSSVNGAVSRAVSGFATGSGSWYWFSLLVLAPSPALIKSPALRLLFVANCVTEPSPGAYFNFGISSSFDAENYSDSAYVLVLVQIVTFSSNLKC